MEKNTQAPAVDGEVFLRIIHDHLTEHGM
jgi:hypothetical protein